MNQKQTTDQTDATLRERVEGFCATLDIDAPPWPWKLPDVLRLTEAMAYRCDGDFVLGLLRNGTIPVPTIDGEHAWSATNVYTLLAQLEGRRRWKLHPAHLHKFTVIERAQLKAEADGRETIFNDLDSFDVEQLLHMMACAEQVELRHAVRLAIQAKLRAGQTI